MERKIVKILTRSHLIGQSTHTLVGFIKMNVMPWMVRKMGGAAPDGSVYEIKEFAFNLD